VVNENIAAANELRRLIDGGRSGDLPLLPVDHRYTPQERAAI
jgi:hypothetical protein